MKIIINDPMKLKILPFSILMILFSLLGGAVEAQGMPTSDASVFSAYRHYKDFTATSMSVPVVVEIPFDDDMIERFDFAVFDKTTSSFQPIFFKQRTLINEIPLQIDSDPKIIGQSRMIDNDTATYAEFNLPENGQGRAQIIMSGYAPITSSSLTTVLDNHVALPTTIEIRAMVGTQNRIIVANRRMDQSTIRFPRTTSERWTISYVFGQPLRISELRLAQENAIKTSSRGLRFLAQPSHSYRIYFDPDRSAAPIVGESGNLAGAIEVVTLAPLLSQKNPNYIMADIDSDGVPDILDNCVSVSNSDQLDVNKNGRGDDCDDFDHDGLINDKDNCPNIPNRNQLDIDGDGLGDVCDEEESRLTERYEWIPWAGIVFAAVVLVILFAITAKSLKDKSSDNNKSDSGGQ